MAEINNDAHGTYNTNIQNKLKMSKLKSSLCDYSDAHTPVCGNIIVPNNRNINLKQQQTQTIRKI